MNKTIVFLAAAALLTGCGGKKKEAAVEEQRPLTKTAVAVSQTISQTEEFTAEIRPWAENNIMPAAQGVHIDQILVDVGSKVYKGQLLVTLDPTLYNQQVVQLGTAKSDYERLLPVFEAGGISAQQIEQAKARVDVQQEVVDNLGKNIRVLSPITGVVTARNSDPGDLFANQPILHVMQIDPVKVTVNIPEQYLPNVKVGMPVELFTEVFPDRTFKGAVALIYPALDAATRTFTVEVRVPNADQALRPGMYARTLFNMGDKAAILVPDVSVLKQIGSSERYLYVVEGDSIVRRRSVKPGRQVDDRIDILSGLSDGETVAVTGFSRIEDGALVEVKND